MQVNCVFITFFTVDLFGYWIKKENVLATKFAEQIPKMEDSIINLLLVTIKLLNSLSMFQILTKNHAKQGANKRVLLIIK